MTPSERARGAHQAAFASEPTTCARAPGRVNLIGEHVDYSGGLVCPVAIDLHTVAVASARRDGIVRLVSTEQEPGGEFAIDGGGAARGAWTDYVQGVAQALRRRGVELRGANITFSSNLPVGAGLSSSAALELAAGAALLALAGTALDRRMLAAASQEAENRYVGVRSGVMDQLVCALGRQDHALLIDTRTLETNDVPLAPEIALVIADSGGRHALATSGYNERRAESEHAAEIIGKSLRDATERDLETLRGQPVLLRRARHIITENERVRAFAAALAAHDFADAGRLMYASHTSLRDDYEVSTPALDSLVERASRMQGVLGARMTGGGFGGSVVVLVLRQAIDPLVRYLSNSAHAVFAVRACDGVSAC